jgi:hypothetical protein
LRARRAGDGREHSDSRMNACMRPIL